MSSLRKYIYDTRGLLRNHHIVDEDYLTDRMIEFWIVTQRATWIKRRDRAFINTDHSLMQTITSEIDSIDRSFLPDTLPVMYKILRTSTTIPKLINFESWDGIVSCGPVDMVANRFNHCEYEEAVRSGYGRFNKTQIFSFLMNSYIYLVSKAKHNYYNLITRIAVTGIFEDPREVANFAHEDGTPCWTEDDEYPLSIELWNYMKTEIVNMNIEALYRLPKDKANDDNSSNNDIP